MKLLDFGDTASRSWFQQILEWSRKKITFDDNIDCATVTAYIGTTETQVGHPLGRTPRYIIEVAAYPNGTAGISFTKEPDYKNLYLTRSVAGKCTLILL